LRSKTRGQPVPEGDRVGDAGDAELPTEGLLPAKALPGDPPGVATPATGDGTREPVAPLPDPGDDPEDPAGPVPAPGVAIVPEEVAAGELDIPGDEAGDTAGPESGNGNGECPGTELGDDVVPAVSGTAPGDIMDGGRGSEADGGGGERELAVGDELVLCAASQTAAAETAAAATLLEFIDPNAFCPAAEDGEEDAGGEAAIGEVEDGQVVKATIDDAEATEEAAAATGETAAAVGGDKEPAGELVGDIVEEVELGAIEVILGGAVGLLEVATGALGVVLRERGVSRVPGGVLTGEAGEDPVLVDNADEARGVFEKVGVVGEELGLVL